MSTVIGAERAKTARLVAAHLASRAWRTAVRLNDYPAATPIVACEWDETVGDVMARTRAARPSSIAVIAIRRGDELKFMAVEPTEPGSASGKVSPASSIGMFYQALEQSGSWTVQITASTTARALAIA